MNSQEMPPVLLRYFDALASGNDVALKECFAAEAKWIAPGRLPNSGTWVGPDEIVDEFFALAAAHMVPGSFSTELVSATIGESNAVVEWQSTATTASGSIYKNSYIANLIFTGDRIVEVREYFDTQQGEVLFAS
jgi:ketosteroid isomerase-like protein